MNAYVGILTNIYIYIYILFWQSNILNHEFHPFGRIQTQSPDSQRHLDQLPPPAIAWEELSNSCKLMVGKHSGGWETALAVKHFLKRNSSGAVAPHAFYDEHYNGEN